MENTIEAVITKIRTRECFDFIFLATLRSRHAYRQHIGRVGAIHQKHVPMCYQYERRHNIQPRRFIILLRDGRGMLVVDGGGAVRLPSCALVAMASSRRSCRRALGRKILHIRPTYNYGSNNYVITKPSIMMPEKEGIYWLLRGTRYDDDDEDDPSSLLRAFSTTTYYCYCAWASNIQHFSVRIPTSLPTTTTTINKTSKKHRRTTPLQHRRVSLDLYIILHTPVEIPITTKITTKLKTRKSPTRRK